MKEQTSIIPLLTRKSRTIKPSPKQKKLAIEVVKNMQSNNPQPIGKIMESIGYGTTTQNPKLITESKGYLQALRDLGLTEELVTTSLVEDIEKKPQNRVKELALASDILQMRKPVELDKKDNSKGNTYNFLFNETTKQQIEDINKAIKQRLLSQ